VTTAPVIDASFLHAFVASLAVIIVSELGDKTFFIAAILAMRHSRLVVFGGAIAALGLMTVLSGNYFSVAVFSIIFTVVPDFGSISGKSRIQPFCGNPAKSGSGQISSRIWWMALMQLQYTVNYE